MRIIDADKLHVDKQINGECWINQEQIINAPTEESVLKALEDVRAETEEQYKWLFSTKYSRYDVDIAFNSIFRIIDKAVKEIEHEASN